MTWCADPIFAEPAPGVIEALSASEALAGHLYHVTNLKEHSWPTPEARHGLPAGGLLVGRGWQPKDFAPTPRAGKEEILLPPTISASTQGDALLALLRDLKRVSARTGTVVSYFHSEMWAGDIEEEYSWVFGPEDVVYVFKAPGDVLEYRGSGTHQIQGDVLGITLQHHGLEIPTAYFALHTRSFPWGRYKLHS